MFLFGQIDYDYYHENVSMQLALIEWGCYWETNQSRGLFDERTTGHVDRYSQHEYKTT